jgi:hypothetical protein
MNEILDYRVRIEDENNRINELIEECRYTILGVDHIDMNEFTERLIRESVEQTMMAIDSGLPVEQYVLNQFGIE